ncbi:MAG: hypothetical protein DI527_13470 [Chelatococcus sp.]|nr:MAG: hypothetical protein DI527_13470 [Chelatococcus sp.]
MRRAWVDFWLDASNIAALLLVGLLCIEVGSVLVLAFWLALPVTDSSPALCRSLSSLWPDRDATAALLDVRTAGAGSILCAFNLLPRAFYIPMVPIALVWMATYVFVRASQKVFPFVAGDDFIRAFIVAVGLARFGTGAYAKLASGTLSPFVPIAIYLVTSSIQLLVIVWFQRRINELTFIASRD